MTNTIEQVIAYAHAHPKNASRADGSWHNWCAAFVYRAGAFTESYSTATLAGNASGPLNKNAASAPRGAIHYWGGGAGHIGFELGNGQILMASNGATHFWGTAMGTATLAEYHHNKPDPIYRGWTMRHGTQTLAPTPKPVVAPKISKATWVKWQTLLKTKIYGYTGAIDGVPGLKTYAALQKMLALKFGYKGAVDGKPGALTWAAYAKAVKAGYPTPVAAVTPAVVKVPVPVAVPVPIKVPVPVPVVKVINAAPVPPVVDPEAVTTPGSKRWVIAIILGVIASLSTIVTVLQHTK